MRRFLLVPMLGLALAGCEESASEQDVVVDQAQSVVAAAPVAAPGAITERAVAEASSTVSVATTSISAMAEPTLASVPRLADVARAPRVEQFGAVGMRISLVDGAFTVADALADMPASEAGLQVGDVVTSVDGMATEGMSLDQFIDLVRGEPGTSVTLQVVSGDAVLDLTVPRAPLEVERSRCERVQALRRDREFGGVGVVLSMTEGCGGDVFIRSVESGMPAETAGLKAGDRIVQVGGMDATGAHVFDVTEALRGEAGTAVELGVIGSDGALRTVTLDRVSIALPEAGACR